MRPGNPAKAWITIEDFLQQYAARWSPARWRPWGTIVKGREGFYVLGRLAVLVAALLLGPIVTPLFARILLVTLASFLMTDVFLVNSAVALVTKGPASHLRSVCLTLVSFGTLGVGFAVFYSLLGHEFRPTLNTTWQALFFSIVTLTTLGVGTFTPHPQAVGAQVLVVLELAVGIYFLVIILASVVAWYANPSK